MDAVSEEIFFLIFIAIDLQCNSCIYNVLISGVAKRFSYPYMHSFLDSSPIEAITECWLMFPVL